MLGLDGATLPPRGKDGDSTIIDEVGNVGGTMSELCEEVDVLGGGRNEGDSTIMDAMGGLLDELSGDFGSSFDPVSAAYADGRPACDRDSLNLDVLAFGGKGFKGMLIGGAGGCELPLGGPLDCRGSAPLGPEL